MKIVVTGSLGHIGKPLATELIQKGHAVTVISSTADRQVAIEAIGATAAIGSLDDAIFLADTFKGADAVFAMVPPSYSEPDQLAYYQRIGKNYVQAIQQSGVKRVVLLSSYGADHDSGTGIILGSHHIEEMLNGLSDVAVTHLRPGYFYYNLYAFTDMIKGMGMIGNNYGGNDKLLLVAPADIATVAAEELTVNGGESRKIRYIASDERTCNEVATVLGAAIGRLGMQWLTFSDEQVLNTLKQRGLPESFAAKLVELGAAIHSGKLMEDYERQQPGVTGKVKLEDFAKEFVVAYSK